MSPISSIFFEGPKVNLQEILLGKAATITNTHYREVVEAFKNI